jgi:hypothetical protein
LKNSFFFPGIFTLLSVLLPKAYQNAPDNNYTAFKLLKQKMSSAITCSPGGQQGDYVPDDPLSMVALPGWGKHYWKIKTSSDSALYYFNQGISFYYAFHIIESLASFKKARTLDENSYMAWWGEALAYGPNINDVEYAASPDALAAIEKAVALSANANDKEKRLIAAMRLRYSNDKTADRATLNLQYKEAMEKLFQQFPDDAEVGALYADAIMLIHPWDLYDQQSKPKAWTPELLTVLEKVLSIYPQHPGANHYYIHAVEASLQPERANASADRLPGLMPKVSHIVHMPSHIYIRTGRYDKGAELNEKANAGYREYLKMFPAVEANNILYIFHNLHMQANCAMMNGSYQYAQESANENRNVIPVEYLSMPSPLGDYVQYMYMTPAFNNIRYGKWKEILNEPILPDSIGYAKSLQHFSRGFAMARLKNIAGAKAELEKLKTIMNSSADYKLKLGAFNSAYDAFLIAEPFLAGIIAEEEGNLIAAEKLLQTAVQQEDLLIYNEPRDWIIPVRQYLGVVQLKTKNYPGAEKSFRDDLVINPLNGWSLRGLASVLHAVGKEKEASVLAKKHNIRSGYKDFNLISPVY